MPPTRRGLIGYDAILSAGRGCRDGLELLPGYHLWRQMPKGLTLNIKFYAHACFRLEGNRTSFITDPYTPSISQFELVGETCDVVIMSSSTDRFHSDASQVPGSPRVLD